MLFREAWTMYQRHMRARGLAASTIEGNRCMLRRLLDLDEPVNALTPDRLVERLDVARQDGLAQATLRKIYSNCNTFARWAVTQGYLTESPTKKVDPPKKPKYLRRPATEEEIAALLLAAKRSRWAPRDVALVLMLARTGIRNGELCSLERRHVDLAEHWAYIGEGGTTKNGEGRWVRFDATTAEALQTYLDTRPPDDDPALFVSQRGRGPISVSGVNQIFRRLCEAAGIDRITPHQLRHYFGTHWANAGLGNDMALQTLMGHSSTTMTRHYAKHSQRTLGRAYDAVFSGKPMPRPRVDPTAQLVVAEIVDHTPSHDELREALAQSPNMLALARLYRTDEHVVRRWVIRAGLLPFYNKRRLEVLTKQAEEAEETIEMKQFIADIATCPNWAELGRRYGLKAESVRDWAKRRGLLPVYYAAKSVTAS